jgi:hypothetical protein
LLIVTWGVVLERPWIKCSAARVAVSLAAHALFQLLKSVSAEPGIDRQVR